MKYVLIYSGGLDSTVLLYHLLDCGYRVHALSLDYGQRHRKELDAARNIAQLRGIEHRVVDLTPLTPFLSGSSLTSPELAVPEGHYAEETMKATVVPNRNMILLSIAAGWGISLKADAIAYAAHAGDHAIYPDCRKEFADAMEHAIALADWHSLRLDRPFVNWTKADIIRHGDKLNVSFSQTWSCYQGRDLHCGRCGTCIERREAFHLAAVDDPTAYESEAPSLETLVANNWTLSD